MESSIYKQITSILASKEVAWLITVVNTDGSSPGKVGMKMLIKANGTVIGTIGGGTIEKLVIDKVFAEKFFRGIILSFDLGKNGVFVKTGMICGGQQEVFVEPLFPSSELYVVGGGHCGQALAELMAKCNFAVTVIDNREEWVRTEKHPYAIRLVCTDYNEIAKHISFTPDTFIVVMTHSHGLDEKVIKELVNKEYKYLGVIGSKTKAKTLLQNLQRDNYCKEKLKQIFIPIGFELGTETPNEIAVSIAAQLLAVKNGIEEVNFNSNPLLLEG